MDTNSTILVTGAAGFIGSCMVSYLNQQGFENLILVDEFSDAEKELNLLHKKYIAKVEREDFFNWVQKERPEVGFVFHLGARTDTTEFDYSIHQHLNVEYSQKIWNYCTINNIPLVYASSAATYGSGDSGYNDASLEHLRPLNSYGYSKHFFDQWAMRQTAENSPPSWAGFKFFNVYGPNEYHKERMASVAFHTFNQFSETGTMRLFKGTKVDVKDGEQLRDFIYVKDAAAVVVHFFVAALNKPAPNGIYNLGTGQARSFKDLATSVMASTGRTPSITYIDMPKDLQGKYQYFTEANMTKLRAAGYIQPFMRLEDGVKDYVQNYLLQPDPYC